MMLATSGAFTYVLFLDMAKPFVPYGALHGHAVRMNALGVSKHAVRIKANSINSSRHQF